MKFACLAILHNTKAVMCSIIYMKSLNNEQHNRLTPPHSLRASDSITRNLTIMWGEKINKRINKQLLFDLESK